jgi:hypothetical protein
VAVVLGDCYLRVGTADALYRGKVFVGRSILRYAEERFSATADFAKLKDVVARLEAADAALGRGK